MEKVKRKRINMMYFVPLMLLIVLFAVTAVFAGNEILLTIRLYNALVRSDSDMVTPTDPGTEPTVEPTLVPETEVLTRDQLPGYPIDGDVIGKLIIEKTNTNSVIYQGSNDVILRKGIGHRFSTLLPGEGGNIVITSHRNKDLSVLDKLEVGDIIYIDTDYAGRYEYEIVRIAIIEPEILPRQLSHRDGETLTMYTDYPIIYKGKAPQRIVVVAKKISGTEVDWSW